VMSRMNEKATTGVVAVVRPEHTRNEAARLRPTRTQTPDFAALNESRGLAFSTRLAGKAVITQDPYRPVSGKQFWSHPPV
jgi:hypothetical protein